MKRVRNPTEQEEPTKPHVDHVVAEVWKVFLRWLLLAKIRMLDQRALLWKLYHINKTYRNHPYIRFVLSCKWFDMLSARLQIWRDTRNSGGFSPLFPGLSMHGEDVRAFLPRLYHFVNAIERACVPSLFGCIWGNNLSGPLLRGPSWKEEEIWIAGPYTFTMVGTARVKTPDGKGHSLVAWEAPGIEAALIFFLALIGHRAEINFIVVAPSWPSGPHPLFLCRSDQAMGSMRWTFKIEAVEPRNIMEFVLAWLPRPADHNLAQILTQRIAEKENDNDVALFAREVLYRWLQLK